MPFLCEQSRRDRALEPSPGDRLSVQLSAGCFEWGNGGGGLPWVQTQLLSWHLSIPLRFGCCLWTKEALSVTRGMAGALLRPNLTAAPLPQCGLV